MFGKVSSTKNSKLETKITGYTAWHTASLACSIDLGEIKAIESIYIGASQDQGANFSISLSVGDNSYTEKTIYSTSKATNFHHELIPIDKIKTRYLQLSRYGEKYEHEAIWLVVTYEK